MSDMYLIHHGIKGQKWGIRRFQNEDGSLTSAGEKRYAFSGKATGQRIAAKVYGVNEKFYNKTNNKTLARANAGAKKRYEEAAKKSQEEANKRADEKRLAKETYRDERKKTDKSLDKKVEYYQRSQKTGKRILKNYLLTPASTMTYDTARALGESRVKAAARSIFDINVGSLAGAAVDIGVSRTGLGNAAGLGANLVTQYKTRNSLGKMSLQQESLRKKYYRSKN